MQYLQGAVQAGALGLGAKQIYDKFKERDQRGQHAFNGCKKGTFNYSHNGKFSGPGGIPGDCGTKKDHSRTFACDGCYHKIAKAKPKSK